MKNKLNRLSALLLVVFCMTSFSISAFAADRGHFASNENGTEIPPNSIDSITVSTENVELPEKSTDTSLTPNGNMTLIDDILQKSPYASDENKQQEKQFITVQTKNGNYFYLVVDRTGETENVYFLNLVDEADLMALTEELEDSEVELVRSYILGELCREYEERFAKSEVFINAWLSGESFESVNRYLGTVRTVTSADLHRVAKAFLDRDNIIEIVVGQ